MLYQISDPDQSTENGNAVCEPNVRLGVLKPAAHGGGPPVASVKLVDVYKDREKSMRFLFELMQERMTEPEINISATMPTWQKHRQFVCRKPYRYWYLIEVEGQWAGYVSATMGNEIGIILAKAHRGKGYGPMAVKMLMGMHDPLPAVPSVRGGRWLANINPKNERSIGMFSKLGFKHKQNTYECDLA